MDLGRRPGTASPLPCKGSGQMHPVSTGKKTVKISWLQQGLQSAGWQTSWDFAYGAGVPGCGESLRWHFLAEIVACGWWHLAEIAEGPRYLDQPQYHCQECCCASQPKGLRWSGGGSAPIVISASELPSTNILLTGHWGHCNHHKFGDWHKYYLFNDL